MKIILYSKFITKICIFKKKYRHFLKKKPILLNISFLAHLSMESKIQKCTIASAVTVICNLNYDPHTNQYHIFRTKQYFPSTHATVPDDVLLNPLLLWQVEVLDQRSQDQH
jgi:hypothetical protein